jgi:hypothetical protein
MKTLSEFAQEQGLEFSYKAISERKDDLMDSQPMNHYRCTLANHKGRMLITFSQGLGITHDPTMADVLNCIASDASGILNTQDFNDWCGDYGYDAYDADSRRKVWKIYTATKTQTAKLEALIGTDALNELAFEVEQL